MSVRRPCVQPQAVFVYHLNVNGLGPRLEELRAATSAASVISLQDTRLRDPVGAEVLWRTWWPDHRVYSFDHDEAGLGCALLVRARLRQRLVLRRTVERHRLLSVEVTLEDGGLLHVASLHVPPEMCVGGAPLRRDFLEEVLGVGPRRRALLVGDLNGRSLELGCRRTNANGVELLEFIEDSGTVVLNNPALATFHHSSCDFSDCLDWALASPAAAGLFAASVGEDVGSDHLPVVVTRPRLHTSSRLSEDLPRWRTTGADWTETFERDLEARLRREDLVALDPPASPSEVEARARAIEAAVSASADACLPRSRQKTESARLALPWWARLLVRERRRLRRRLVARPDDADLRRRLGLLRRDVRVAVAEARRLHVQRKLAPLADGPREPTFWPAVRSWFRAPGPHPPPLRTPDLDAPAVTPEERAAEFARHLELALGVPTHPSYDDDFRREVEETVEEDVRLRPRELLEDVDEEREEPTAPVSPYDVGREIHRLRGGKAPGPDGISSDLLKAAPFSLAVVLAALFSGSLRCGYVPSRWRVAWVRLLPKAGRALTSAADFRPVSLTSCVGKILERIFARRLLVWCDQRSLLPVEQSGFRYARDALEQVVLLTQRAVQECNGGRATAVAALDVAKAYDSVWHAGLLFLCREVLPVSSSRWIAGFLHQRSAAVLEAGALSAPFVTSGGVPQGSPLSPLLYVFFTREMPLPRGRRLGATAFADDVALWASAACPSAAWRRLEPHLSALVAWGRRWRLRFNAEKTQAAYFSRRRGGWSPEEVAAPFFSGIELRWSQHLDLLGVRLDRELRFGPHAQWVSGRVAPRTLDLRRLLSTARTVPVWVGLLLLKTLIWPALSYAAPVLGLASDTAWRTLERAERRGLRAALRSRTNTRIPALYRWAAAAGRLRDECARFGARFLLRHSTRGNHHLLAAFSEETPQHAGLVRVEPPLERLLASLEPPDRANVVRWIRDNVEPPTARRHPGRLSRSARRTAAVAVSPWTPDPAQ